MQNFVLHNQTKIIFGKDTLTHIGPETSRYGHKALLVYGQQSLVSTGVFQKIRTSLEQAGVQVICHGGVQSNPLLSHVRQGISLAQQENIAVIVAAGGGSVIDSAKAISAGVPAPHDVWKFFTGKKSIKKTIPLLCVVTLAAAGSEMNGGMVLTHDEKRHKFGTGNKLLNPQVSILDPTLTSTVPRDYTVYGAIDAIAHILEFYFTSQDPSTPVQDRFMEGLLLSIMESCELLMTDMHSYQGRADLLWCSTMALNGWTAAGLGHVGFPMHLIEHTLSAHYNVAHGAGLAVVMPGWMQYQAHKSPKKFAQFGRRVMACSEQDDLGTALAAITKLKKWFRKQGAPTTLTELGISQEAIPTMARETQPLAKIWRLPEYNEKIITDILTSCLS